MTQSSPLSADDKQAVIARYRARIREEGIQIADNAIQMLHFEMSDTIPHDIP